MIRERSDNSVDQAAMLLSTDWFLPYWPLIGIEVASTERFQKGCRDIVLRLIDGAEDYYLINFSLERVDRTRESMRHLASECGLSEPSKPHLEKLISHKPEREQFYKTARLFRSLTGHLLGDADLDASIRLVIRRCRDESSFSDDFDFEQMCLSPDSPWDKYIRGLTPELPTCLSDLVSVSLLADAEFSQVMRRLTAEQKMDLLSRFKSAAHSLYGIETEPVWSEEP